MIAEGEKNFRMIEHQIVLTGSGFDGAYFKPEAMSSVERTLPIALRDAMRMRLYASSRRIGRPLQALHNSWDLWLGDIKSDAKSGGTSMIARVPTLGDAAPKLFEQTVLYDDGLNREDTVFDLLADAITDVRSENRNSALFDSTLLKTVSGARRHGLDTLQIHLPNRKVKISTIDEKVVDSARRLQAEAPNPERIRIMGKLDALFFGDRSFILELQDGSRLRGAWMKDDPEPLQTHWGRDVLIEGVVRYKPNGEALGLEAEVIKLAEERDRFYANVPKASTASVRKPVRPIIRPVSNPWDLVIGIWPGNESDDEFAELLERMS